MTVKEYYDERNQEVPNFSGLANDSKPTIASHSGLSEPAPGSRYLEYDTPAWYFTRDGTNWSVLPNPLSSAAAQAAAAAALLASDNAKRVVKASTTPLTSGTLFNITGKIYLIDLGGVVTTVIQSQSTTMLYSWKTAERTAEVMCTALDLNGFLVGTALGITGTYTDALQGVSGKPSLPMQATPLKLYCLTTGIISATFTTSGASSGTIEHHALWIPAESGGLMVAA